MSYSYEPPPPSKMQLLLHKQNTKIIPVYVRSAQCYKRPADLCNMKVEKGNWQLDMRGFVCQPLGYGKTELHNLVPPIRIEPFLKDTRLGPVYHLVRLEKSLVKLRPQSETCFWLSSRQPYRAITPITMCR